VKHKTHIFFLVATIIVWAGCVTREPIVTDGLSTETPVSPSLTAQELPSLTPAIGESIALPISTEPTPITAIPLCPQSGSQNSASTEFGIEGTIIYQKHFQGLYTVGGNPLRFSKLPMSEEQKYSTFGFSTDGNWFAFSPLEYTSAGNLIFESPKIVLLSVDGKKIEQTFSVEQFSSELQVAHRFMGFSGYSYWINNNTIYAVLYSMNPNPNTTRKINDLPKVLEPFTNIW